MYDVTLIMYRAVSYAGGCSLEWGICLASGYRVISRDFHNNNICPGGGYKPRDECTYKTSVNTFVTAEWVNLPGNTSLGHHPILPVQASSNVLLCCGRTWVFTFYLH